MSSKCQQHRGPSALKLRMVSLLASERASNDFGIASVTRLKDLEHCVVRRVRTEIKRCFVIVWSKLLAPAEMSRESVSGQ